MTNRRLEGRDEPILDPDLPIIDAHHHLWRHPTLGYMLDDYLEDTVAGHRIVASVYVETQAFARRDGPEILRPIGEVEFANGAAAMTHSGDYGPCRACAAIVGYADLRAGDAVAELLDRALQTAPERYRGIRQVTMEHPSPGWLRYIKHPPPQGIMQSAGFRAGLRQLAARGLSFDAAVFHTQLGQLAELADAVPDLTIVLNHIGVALGLDLDEHGKQAVFRDWRVSLRDLARRPNVVCKIGGLGVPQWGFGFEERSGPIGHLDLAAVWGPYIETGIEAFGPDRCMMESNYSADARSCGFVPLWNALKHIVRDYSPEQKLALFQRTAARVYRIDLPKPDDQPEPGSNRT